MVNARLASPANATYPTDNPRTTVKYNPTLKVIVTNINLGNVIIKDLRVSQRSGKNLHCEAECEDTVLTIQFLASWKLVWKA